MRKRTLALGLFIVFVNLSVFSFFSFSSASSYGNYDAAVVIDEDGKVVGTSLIQVSGNQYTFTGSISLSNQYFPAGIQVLKDNIVIDGANYALETNNEAWTGIDLTGRSNVTVKNVEISGFQQGILLEGSSGNRLYNNKIIGFSSDGDGPYGVPTGIWLSCSSNNTIASNTVSSNIDFGILVQASSTGNVLTGNTVTNNSVGIALDYCPDNTLRNNQMINNDKSLKLGYNTYEQFIQDIDASNTINGKPTYYWLNQNDRAIPADAGFVALGNCDNITIKDLYINHTYDSITLINTNNSAITNNHISYCGNGIFLKYCQNITVTWNTIIGNSDSGIGTIACDNIAIAENNIDHCNFGISPSGVTRNHLGGRGSTNLMIFSNNITNCNPGMYFSLSSNCIISQNLFRENAYGVNLVQSTKNNFTENTFIENSGGALRISDAYNNTFFHNNFNDNELDSQVLTQWYLVSTYETNAWDNGHEGNYWSNFEDRYPNATEISQRNTWNTPYYIDDVNIDNHPLVNPHKIGTDKPETEPETDKPDDSVVLPSISPSPSPSPEQTVSEPLPTEVLTVSVASVAIASIGLIVYFKKRKH